MRERVLLSWSGGKDSAMTLFELQRGGYEVAALLTTITEPYDRISMHGVRRVVLERQAEALGLPLRPIFISSCCMNEEYEQKMKEALLAYQPDGVQSVAFGDIFLEDLRTYREGTLAKIGMKGLFPIWKRNTGELARTFLELGFRGIVVCVDSKALDGAFVGRDLSAKFFDELPPSVDHCGENGEFHSFVFDGPIFHEPVRFSRGEVVQRDSSYFCDLLSA